eukprot:GHVL01043282.1.p1 GENE.GHVL01043282.1~~GHVL01043282.1.p1  ORF type:complete len:873 (-),score=207.16 GHVL01043282.1:43-2661(-)
MFQNSSQIFREFLGLASFTFENKMSICRQSTFHLIMKIVTNNPESFTSKGDVEAIVDLLFRMAIEVDDDLQEWINEPDENTHGDGLCASESALDAAADLILEGGAEIGKALFIRSLSILSEDRADWKMLHAALLFISEISEAEDKTLLNDFKKKIDKIIPINCKLLEHQNPKIRWASFHLFQCCFERFSPKIQRKWHSGIIPSLVTQINNDTAIRVKTRGLRALGGCVGGLERWKDSEEDIWFRQYIDLILKNCVISNIQNWNLSLQAVGLGVTSHVAEIIGEEFLPFYADFIKICEIILTNVQSIARLENADLSDVKLLFESAIDLVGRIAEAVGEDVFKEDAPRIIHLLFTVDSQEEKLPGGLEITSSVIEACSKIMICLGKSFERWLDVIVVPVLSLAGSELEQPRITADGTETEKLNLEYVGVKLKTRDGGEDEFTNIILNIAQIEKKSAALNFLGEAAEVFGESFKPYLPSTVQAVIQSLDYHFFKTVKESAVSIVSQLMIADPEVFPGIILDKWICSLLASPFTQLAELLDPMPECWQKLFIPLVCSHNIQVLLDKMASFLDEMLARAVEKELTEESDDLFEILMNIYSCILDVFSSKNLYYNLPNNHIYKPNSHIQIHIWNNYSKSNFLPIFLSFFNKNVSEEKLVSAICVLGFTITYGGAGVVDENMGLRQLKRILELSVPVDPDEEDDEDDARVQSACWLLGLLAEYMKCISDIEETMRHLRAVLQHPRALTKERHSSTDDAACALLKCLLVYAARDDTEMSKREEAVKGAIELLNSFFPLIHDPDEAKVANSLMFSIICQNPPPGYLTDDLKKSMINAIKLSTNHSPPILVNDKLYYPWVSSQFEKQYLGPGGILEQILNMN